MRPKTLLQAFLDQHGIRAAKLEERARVSRRQLVRWRQDPAPTISLGNMIRILRATRQITGIRVQMTELFDLEPDNWQP